MTCRESGLTSALTTIARCMTGLDDNQVLSLSHQIQNEHASTAGTPPTVQEWNTFIDEQIAGYNAGTLYITPGSSDPRRRFEAARHEIPTRARYEAARRIVARSIFAEAAHRDFLANIDRALGNAEGTARETFNSFYRQATQNPAARADPDWQRDFLENPDNLNLFSDRRSAYAYLQMLNMVDAHRSVQPSRPTVERSTVRGSSVIAEEGYDPSTGRLEIVMHSNPDRVYAYRVSPSVYRAFQDAPSMGSFYAHRIRGNRDFLYSTQGEAQAAGTLTRCSTCGQYEGDTHACPVIGSEEEISRDVRVAVEERRGTATTPLPRLTLLHSRLLPTENGMLRMTPFARMQQQLALHPSFLVPVSVSTTEGNVVSGYVHVEDRSATGGHETVETELYVSAVTEPGDSGRDNLRCDCAEYRRRYQCEHTQQTVDAITTMLNDRLTPPSSRAELQDTILPSVTTALTEEYAASVTSIAVSRENWHGVESSFADDPEIFQNMYKTAREARALYKDSPDTAPYPVPFYTENAFGGLATRESGRGFGIEIEYSFPDSGVWRANDDANAAIGQALRDAGLTRQARMDYYGASHGWIRDHQAEGWAFEEDGSTYGGGEIISPISYDEAETWENLQKVLAILKEHGAVPTKNCGLHVHVGTGDYDHTVANHNRLLSSLYENEDLLYRLSANPEANRHRGTGYCQPNNPPSAPYRAITNVRSSQSGHHLALNMQATSGNTTNDNVEFRTFDASLNAGVIQAQIGLSLYLVEGALRPGTSDPQSFTRHPLGESLAANPRRTNLTGEAWHATTKGVRTFIDKYLPGTTANDEENPQVKQFVSLFAIGKWQKNSRGNY